MSAEQDPIVGEIQLAEKARADKLKQNDRLTEWVKGFRKKYIADGFLMPFYAFDGRYSRPRQRINQFGDFILPGEMAGKIFHPNPPARRILQEDIWFWDYLIQGQEAIFMQPMPSFPDILRIDGMPAEPIWNMIIDFTRQTGLFGGNSGGVISTPDDLEEGNLARMVPEEIDYERENGYIETRQIEGQPRWITLFHRYKESEYGNTQIETRPAWFHLVNFAFYDIPVIKLPVFLGVFKNGKVNIIRFLAKSLSDQARDFIGKVLLGIPIEFKKRVDTKTLRLERNEMTWWLWHNVGHRESGKTLSYGEIADIVRVPRSSIQTVVRRFACKLKVKLDGKLLGRLLRISYSLGLEYNLTYRALVKQGLAPTREREIDGFDDIDKLL